MDITRYSERDIIDWRGYERVRLAGHYNMFDPRAREMTGMTRERYIFILENYSGIQDQLAEMKVQSAINDAY
tara:strand:- start:129 stop:344 length:216 start_codon:yes stop_codon:yes gene_type:complete